MDAKGDIDQSGIMQAQETPARKRPRVSTSSKVTPAKKVVKKATKKAAPKEAEVAKQDVTITKEELASQMQLLSQRARDAGLSPIRSLVQAYGALGMGVIEGLLLSLDNAGNSKKKKKK